MTNEQKEQIRRLRADGHGYATIAEALRQRGIETICYTPQTAMDCFDKWRTHEVLKRGGFRVADAFYVHHEPTFERDEVRRHQTVIVLTPTRLMLAHTDEHPGDDMLPEPYTSTSTASYW